MEFPRSVFPLVQYSHRVALTLGRDFKLHTPETIQKKSAGGSSLLAVELGLILPGCDLTAGTGPPLPERSNYWQILDDDPAVSW